jgi:hypothetical protein
MSQTFSEPTGQEHLTPVRIKDTSATERIGFRKCRRQWFLSVVHRLDQERGNVNFFLGNIYHAALAAYYESLRIGLDTDQAETAALDTYQEVYDEETKALRERLGIGWSLSRDEYRGAGELGLEMLQNYLEKERVNPLLDEVLAVEFRVNIPIRSPKGRKVGALSVQADVVGRKEGVLRVVDHKTASRAPNLAHLDIDDQLTAEVYSWWKHSGEFPEQAVYNASMKREAGPPRLLKNGRLSKDKNQGTTAELYRLAIHEHGLDPADYADMLTYLDEREARDDDPLFVRDVTFRTPGQMVAFERDLREEFRDMRLVAIHPERAYPNPSPFTCPSCPVRAICITIQDDGDVAAVIKAGYVVAEARR